MTVVPLPTSLSTSTEPPWACIMCLTMERPRPVPPGRAAAALVHAVEALEDVGQVGGGNADAIVGDANRHRGFVAPGGDGDAPGRVGVGDGIFHQVVDDLLETHRVDLDRGQVFGNVQFDGRPIDVSLFFPVLHELLEEGIGPNEAKLELNLLGLEAGEDEEILDQGVQPLGLAAHGQKDAFLVFDRQVRVIHQRFEVAAENGEGRAQLVRDVGDETRCGPAQGA